ncbi:MAG TPA: XRE family transcriptional regulator [Longimicrobiaceae bacterium]|nr:XRE family transcriptional regulator [Longimicrobiaceae bacterium]
MARKFDELRQKMPPERRARIDARTGEMLAEMPLQELRHARRMTQETLADALGLKQAGVSKLERRTDMYVSTLRKYVAAMGGELEITARFPEGAVSIGQFRDLRDAEGPGPSRG